MSKAPPATLSEPPQSALSKLPQVTLLFWVIKLIATTLGETGADFISKTEEAGYGYPTLILLGLFAIMVVIQVKVKKYYPPLYWAVIFLTLTGGTTMADCLTRTLHFGYMGGSALLVGILAAIFVIWWLSGLSFSVQNVRSVKIESLYWAAIMFSNTLGTALGDYMTDKDVGENGVRLGLGLDYSTAALIVAGLLAVTGGLKLFTRISTTLLFWVAFVLTRPFGATMGDLLYRKKEEGCLDYGTEWTSAVLGSAFVLLVVWATVKHYQEQKNGRPAVAAEPAA